VHIIVHNLLYNAAKNSFDNPLVLKTIINAYMLSTGGRGYRLC